MGIEAAIFGAGVIGGGASLIGASKQAGAAEDAAGLSYAATLASIKEQRRQYEQTREDFAPYRETGTNALAEYAKLYGVGQEGLISPEEMEEARQRFKTTPGYEFRFDEGVRALDRSAAARGKLRGGGYARELTRYGQGVASDEFGSYADRLAGIAGMGQGATQSTATLGQQTAGNISNALMTGAGQQGNALMQAGTARASGYAGIANAATGGIQNWLYYNALG